MNKIWADYTMAMRTVLSSPASQIKYEQSPEGLALSKMMTVAR